MGALRWLGLLVSVTVALGGFTSVAAAVEPVLDPQFDGRLGELLSLQGLGATDPDNAALEELVKSVEVV